MNTISPIFEEIFRSFMPHTESIEMQAYRLTLKRHDWEYQYSDDGSVWRKGHVRFEQLKSMQKILDPDFTVWDAIAPIKFRKNK